MTHPVIPCAACAAPVRVIGDEGGEQAVWCPTCGSLQMWGYSAEEGLSRPSVVCACGHHLQAHAERSAEWKGGCLHCNCRAEYRTPYRHWDGQVADAVPMVGSLYRWTDLVTLSSWSAGEAVALATTKEQAIDLVCKAHAYGSDSEPEATVRAELIEESPVITDAPVAFTVLRNDE